MITISVDGAIREPIRGAIGFVVRECNDSILFSGGRSFANILDPFVIETLALREAIIWGIERNIPEINFEGDALDVQLKITHPIALHPRGG